MAVTVAATMVATVTTLVVTAVAFEVAVPGARPRAKLRVFLRHLCSSLRIRRSRRASGCDDFLFEGGGPDRMRAVGTSFGDIIATNRATAATE